MPANIRVAVNGYGVIGKRVADAVALQDDMALAGVADVAPDWRPRIATRKGFQLFGATAEHTDAMRQAGIAMAGTLDDLLADADVVVDCTPKRVAAKNIETYRRLGRKFILQGGEKHEATGHSFVAESSYASAVGRDATRVVSCNTTSIVRTLTALKRVGLLRRARGTLLRRAVPSVKVTPKSAAGAGDSFLVAMTLGLAQARSPDDSFTLAVAAGTAAVLTMGTELCRREDVERDL